MVLRILLRVVDRALQETVGAPLPAESRLGAVSFLHRFGSALNPHPHFHLAVTDGLFAPGPDDALVFHPARRLDADTARSLTPVVQRRILRLYVRRGLLTRSEADDMLGWRGTGGFSLDGSVRVAAHDRAGLERLLRYCARPPFALHRLRHATPDRPLSSPDARLVYHLPRPARDGRTALRLAPLELLDRLARLIPPPRRHRHRYHGGFAPNAAWRPEVVRYGREDTNDVDPSGLVPSPVDGTDPCRQSQDRSPSAARARSLWAQLLARVYEIDPLRCPGCHGEMRIVSFLTDPPVVRQILERLDLPIRAPPLAPARGPPQHDLLAVDPPSPFDLHASAPAERDPFDQSLPGDDGTWSA